MDGDGMKPGDVVELAIWLSGRESDETIAKWKADCAAICRQCEQEHGVIVAPMVFHTKGVTEDRVPSVPDHITGPDVKLLVGEAKVWDYAKPVITKQSGFTTDLERDDLERLRGITRRAHRKARPHEPVLTDIECDRIIESFGPETAVKTLREDADGRSLH